MAIRLTCPNCGARSVEEWVHGEIFDVPPHIDDPDQRELDRSFMHNNPEGPVREAWFHAYGCRRWLAITRDTTSDEVIA